MRQPAPTRPDFSFETQYAGKRVCGVDEAGRGPLAGPVVAAAVILPLTSSLPPTLNDSKKLSPTRREQLFDWITTHAHYGVAVVEAAEIDRLNILRASLLAMAQAVEALTPRPDVALIDGNASPPINTCHLQTIVKGDSRSLSIAAASILAKVTRDRLMQQLATRYPEYGFDRHQGYGTSIHLDALLRYGACPEHRRSFAPVKAVLSTPEEAVA